MFFFYSYSVFLFFLLSCLERRGLSFFISDLLEIFLTFGRVILVRHRNSFLEEDRLLQLLTQPSSIANSHRNLFEKIVWIAFEGVRDFIFLRNLKGSALRD